MKMNLGMNTFFCDDETIEEDEIDNIIDDIFDDEDEDFDN